MHKIVGRNTVSQSHLEETLITGEKPTKRQRHAEKFITPKGVIVKIEHVSNFNSQASTHKSGSVCVHVFTNLKLKNMRKTLYGLEANRFWRDILSSNFDSTSQDLTKDEFRRVMLAVQKCTLAFDGSSNVRKKSKSKSKSKAKRSTEKV